MFNPYDFDTKTFNTTILGVDNRDELIAWCGDDGEKALHVIKVFLENDEELESIIAKDYYSAFKYAKEVLKGRFELGEEAISKDPYASYAYADEVLKGAFTKGEEVISKNFRYAYQYARDVIKGRFELGEEAIATKPEVAIDYAMYVLKGRFELGEKNISNDVYYNYHYTKNVLDVVENLAS